MYTVFFKQGKDWTVTSSYGDQKRATDAAEGFREQSMEAFAVDINNLVEMLKKLSVIQV